MNQVELRRYLAVIKRAVSLIEGMMDNDDGGLLEQLVEESNVSKTSKKVEIPKIEAAAETEILSNEARNKHIKDLMDINCWPEAVPQHLMAGPTEDDQSKRAKAVLDMMLDRDLKNLKFLDFGCGEGWVANEAYKRGCSNVTGFDISPNDNWSKFEGPDFTSVWNEIPKNHFDVVFLYDVLDHCFEPEQLMEQIYDCIKGTGVVYIRCHPWTSRHATHLWKQGINKAYLHLFLKWEEMQKLIGETPMFTRIEKDPLQAYRWWFNKFEIVKERLIEEPVSDFFKVPAFKELLANEQEIENIDQFLKFMSISFIDYALTVK